MVNKKIVRYVLLLTGIAATVVYMIVFSEENRVRRVITSAVALVEKNADDPKLALVARSNKLKPYLADELIVDIPAYRFQGAYTQQDIAASVLAAFFHAEVISVKLFDLTVEISSDTEASAAFTAEISGKLQNQEKDTDYLQFSCRLRKTEGDWRLYRMEMIETLEK